MLDFGMPGNRAWRRVCQCYLRYAVPIWGRCFAGNAQAYAYILESLAHYPAGAGITQLLEQSGWSLRQQESPLGGAAAIHRAVKV